MYRYLRLLILTSVTAGALLGVAAQLGVAFGEVQAKTTATSFSITGAGMFVFAAVSAPRRGWLRTVRVAGAVSAAGGFGLVIFGIWGEPGASVYWKSTATLLVVAAAAGLLGILSHAVLPSKQRWVGASAAVLIGIVAVYGLVLMWVDSEAQWSWRIFGIAGVLLAAAVVAVPVLHSTESRQVSGGGLPIRFCPFCGAGAVGTLGAATGCPSCGRAFVVRPAG